MQKVDVDRKTWHGKRGVSQIWLGMITAEDRMEGGEIVGRVIKR